MPAFSLFESFVLLAFELMIVIGYFLWMTDVWLGDDFVTNKEEIRKVSQIISAYNCHEALLYDLGSCRGAFSIGVLNASPNLRVIGIDNSYLRVWISRLRSLFSRSSPTFVKADIFDTDVSKADLIFVYLPRPLLPALEVMLLRDLRPGSLVITNRVNFPNWRPDKIFLSEVNGPKQEHIFVYRKA